MATGFLALLDDIATVLDDVAGMTKMAAQRTAGVVADDLAVNAEQVSGVSASRELAVVWAVAKGSLVNKAILIPAAVAISVFAHWAITPLLMIGGSYLCFEGFEKVAHRFLHSKEEDEEHHKELSAALADPKVDLLALEKSKIRGAIRTDFILSAEIVVLAMGTVPDVAYLELFLVLCTVGVVMTVGVYGLVAGIVRLDDLGVLLARRQGGLRKRIGRALVALAPMLMKVLAVGGTVAMFLVGGGILVHGIKPLGHFVEGFEAMGGAIGLIVPNAIDLVTGLIAGGLLVALITLGKRLLPKRKSK